jgi:limonene-1,2-epoxide hydrolase
VSPSEVCVAYLAAFSSGESARIASFVTEDFVNEHTAALGSGCIGQAEYARRVPAFLASMPGLTYDIDEVIADGSRVAVAYVLRATVNDRPIAVSGMMRFVVDGDRIAKRTDYWDSLVFKQQAGFP